MDLDLQTIIFTNKKDLFTIVEEYQKTTNALKHLEGIFAHRSSCLDELSRMQLMANYENTKKITNWVKIIIEKGDEEYEF